MNVQLATILQNTINKEDIINANITALSEAARFSYKSTISTGLRFGYYGGTQTLKDGTTVDIADGYVTCVASKTNYIEFDFTTKKITVNQTGFTVGNIPLYTVVTNASVISSIVKNKIISFDTYKDNNYADDVLTMTAAIPTSATSVSFKVDSSYDITKKKFDIMLKCTTATSSIKVNDLIDFYSDNYLKYTYLNDATNTINLIIFNNSIKYIDPVSFSETQATSANFQFILNVYN